MAKGKRNNKNKANKINYEISTSENIRMTLISAFIILAIVVGFGIAGVSLHSRLTRTEISIDDVWAEAFASVESNRVGIVFNSMSTTDEEYDLLRNACNTYIESIKNPDDTDANLSVDIDVSEQSYIDGNIDNNSKSNLHNDDRTDDGANPNPLNQVETGPVYFEDMLMIRYINSDGLMNVATGAFDYGNTQSKSSNNTVVLSQPELSEFYSNNFKTIATVESEEDAEPESTPNKTIPESEYMMAVSDCIKQLMLARSNSDEQAAMNKALNYFTSDGKESVLNGKELLEISDDTEISYVFGMCGKSSTSQTVKDRVYLQYDVVNGDNITRVNIIVKLNSNLRIFDIDII